MAMCSGSRIDRSGILDQSEERVREFLFALLNLLEKEWDGVAVFGNGKNIPHLPSRTEFTAARKPP